MGPNSTAKIPVNNKVDNIQEIMLNAFATSYDALNSVMLTKKSGFFDKTTMQEINGRFGILRMLCLRHSPDHLSDVDMMYKIVKDNYHNQISDIQALEYLRSICLKYDLDPGQVDNAIIRINQAENKPSNFDNLDQMFPFWVQPQKKGPRSNKNFYRRVMF